MKKISKTEARNILNEMNELGLAEDTIILQRGLDNNCVILATLEDRSDCCEPYEYPENIAALIYGCGSGWEIDYSVLLGRDGDTLISKIVDEQGYHAGEINILSENVIDTYLDMGVHFIAGKESHIREMLPLLRSNIYCFIFTDRMERYKELKDSAEKAITDFKSWASLIDTEEEFLRSNIYSMTELYDSARRDNISSDDTWREVIFRMLRLIVGTKKAKPKRRIWVKDNAELEIENIFLDGEEVYIGYSLYISDKKCVSSYESLEFFAHFISENKLSPAGEAVLLAHVTAHWDELINKPFLNSASELMKEMYGGLLCSDTDMFTYVCEEYGHLDKDSYRDFLELYHEAYNMGFTNDIGEGLISFSGDRATAYDSLLCEFNLVGSDYDF